MLSTKFATLVLAAGKGTRMKSALPKVLHRACGRSLLEHVLVSAQKAGAERHYVVVGHGRDEVVAELGRLGISSREAWQKEQKGTGHAAQTALPLFAAGDDTIMILSGDAPLLRPETLTAMLEAHRARKADLTLGVMEPANPYGYGRVVLGKSGAVDRIVEEKEASEKEKKIRVVNGGLYVVSRKFLEAFLPKLKPSAKVGELYLTDILGLGRKAKKKLFAFSIPPEELLGVNDLAQLAEVEAVLRSRLARDWMVAGVRLEAPGSLFTDVGVVIEAGAVIGPNVVLRGKTRIGAGAVVEAGCVLKDAVVEAGAQIFAYSHLEEAVVRGGAKVGPFARLRPGSDVGPEAKIGNFVELKKAKIGRKTSVAHLSYVGDAEVGSDVNVGCGFVACNYDGVNKHQTKIEDGAFIGSNVNAIAPITIGAGAFVATGATLNKNVPADALAIARAPQENKEGYASRLKARMQAIKKAKG